jgi:hypothetical protein
VCEELKASGYEVFELAGRRYACIYTDGLHGHMTVFSNVIFYPGDTRNIILQHMKHEYKLLSHYLLYDYDDRDDVTTG